MAEIVVGMLAPIIELAKCLVLPVKRHFNRLCCFDDNMKSLSDEGKKLGKEITKKEEQVVEDQNIGRMIVSDATDWQTEANQIMEKVQVIEAKSLTLQSGCLALKSRYLLSKKIDKVAKELKKHMDKSKSLVISKPRPPASMMPVPPVQAHEFPSRKEIEEDVMKALRENNVSLLGIGGMGGLGKTTMAKIVMQRVQHLKLFDEVLMVAVGQCVDKLDIQQQIADWLKLSLEGRTLEVRACGLRDRLLKRDAKRIFMVVDDVWDQLELSDLGIPCDESGRTICTILLTSRSEGVLKRMNAKVFTMKVLCEEEARSLFKIKVGYLVDDRNLISIANQLVNECRGLPLALAVLGSALKDENDVGVWRDLLAQLRGSNLANIPEFLKEVFPVLEQSYKHLNDSAAKCLFLLCSQFPEDSDISLNELSMYSMSLRLLGRISSMEETRDRVSAVVKSLKSRSLLLDGEDINYVKIHDVVRDVAILIAEKEGRIDISLGYPSIVECEWIFMFPKVSDDIHDHLVGTNYPKLGLLAIQKKDEWRNPLIIENLPSLDGMKKLRSLSFTGISIKSLPQTSMRNLSMLRLVNSNVECILIIGELVGLEIFVCNSCDQIEELPREISGLKRLKLLEFKDCSNLKRIAPGVISNLTELEELIMWCSFNRWESTEINHEEIRNASLKELESLTKLKRLWIHITSFGSSLVDYRIRIGLWIGDMANNYKKSLTINGLPQHIICENWIHQLVSTTEALYLRGNGSTNFDVSNFDYNTIKYLEIRDDERVEELIHSTSTSTSANSWSCGGVFSVLESLKLANLPALKNILCVDSVPKGSISFKNLAILELARLPLLTSLWKIPNQKAEDAFLQLKEVTISDCGMMEEVFYSDESGNEGMNSYYCIKFPKLKTLVLSQLPSLMTFAKGIECIQFPLLTSLEILGCSKLSEIVSSNGRDQKVTFGSLMQLTISGHIFKNIWCSPTLHPSFGQIDYLHIVDSESVIMSFYSSSVIPHFVNLKSLRIWKCGEMEKVIANEVFF